MRVLLPLLAAVFLAAPLRAEGPARNIRDFGAQPDGTTLATVAINAAVAAAARDGGGTVLVPAGRFLTGTIYLRSGVTLHLDNGAELLGSVEMRDYPENPAPPVRDTAEFKRIRHLYPANLEYGRYALICAQGQHDVAVTGHGRINGQGGHPNFSKTERRARGMPDREAYLHRPYGLSFVGCERVSVRDITIVDAAFWCQDYLDCDGVVVDGVTVNSRFDGANNDGIDLDGSRDVRVANCRFYSGDDSICFKSSFTPCRNITITNCICSSFANGVKFGTASIANLAMDGIGAAGLALEVVDGGAMENVVIANVTMNRVGAALFVRLGDRGRRWMREEDKPGVGTLRHVTIDNVVATMETDDPRPLGCSITGLPGHPVEDISVSNFRVRSRRTTTPESAEVARREPVGEHADEYPEYSTFGSLPAFGLYVRHARGITLRNCEFRAERPEYRSAIYVDDVEDLATDGLRSNVLPGSQPVVVLRDVRRAALRGSLAPAGTGTYLRVEGRAEDVTVHASDLRAAQTPVDAEEAVRSQVAVESE